MKLLFSIFLIITGIAIFFFQKIENYLIESNFSWLFSKAFPYSLLFILGIILFLLFRKAFSVQKKIVSFLFGFILITSPFLVGLLLNPIYEGDFSNVSRKPNNLKVYEEFKNAQLVVVSIPGCPYCMGSIDLQKKMIARNPKLKVNFVVCDSRPESIDDYKKEIGNSPIKAMNTANGDAFAKLADGSFPCFLMVKNGKAIKKWAAGDFGMSARDEVENEVK
jgi:hypothetical protein